MGLPLPFLRNYEDVVVVVRKSCSMIRGERLGVFDQDSLLL